MSVMTDSGKVGMTAVAYRQYGSPDVLAVEHRPIPEPAENEVLVRVHASTVNRTDCGFLRGKPFIVRFFSGLLRPKAQVLGCEFAGEVVAVGTNVKEFSNADRVFAFKDDDYGFGGHAEYTVMPVEGMIAKIPDSVTSLQAAAALEGAHYALHYIRAARITSEDSVLVNGATGAIGSAAVQLIREMGARVTAVCATEHVELIERLGANEVIDYKRQDFTELAETFDVVFDAVGKSTSARCRRLLREGGSYMSTEPGPWWQNAWLGVLSKILRSRKVLFPLPRNLKEDATLLQAKMQDGSFLPLIDKTFRLEEVAEAFRYVETGMKVGNVVIKIG